MASKPLQASTEPWRWLCTATEPRRRTDSGGAARPPRARRRPYLSQSLCASVGQVTGTHDAKGKLTHSLFEAYGQMAGIVDANHLLKTTYYASEARLLPLVVHPPTRYAKWWMLAYTESVHAQ